MQEPRKPQPPSAPASKTVNDNERPATPDVGTHQGATETQVTPITPVAQTPERTPDSDKLNPPDELTPG